MDDYDPDRVSLSPVSNGSTAPLTIGSREPILIQLDSELAEAVLMISDYIPAALKQKLVELMFSILLTALLMEKIDDCVDAMERIISRHLPDMSQEDSGKLWGEFMTVISVWLDRYENDDILKNHLEDILPSDIRIFPEEFFQVRWSKQASYLLIQ